MVSPLGTGLGTSECSPCAEGAGGTCLLVCTFSSPEAWHRHSGSADPSDFCREGEHLDEQSCGSSPCVSPGTRSRGLWGLRVTYALSPVCSDMDGLQGRCSLVAACQGRIRRKLSRGASLKARRALHLPQVPSWDSWEKKKHAWSWAKPWASTQGHVFTSSAFLSAHGQEVLVNISTACS